MISTRHSQHKSAVITTDTAFSEWGNILFNITMATAIADRLVENSVHSSRDLASRLGPFAFAATSRMVALGNYCPQHATWTYSQTVDLVVYRHFWRQCLDDGALGSYPQLRSRVPVCSRSKS